MYWVLGPHYIEYYSVCWVYVNHQSLYLCILLIDVNNTTNEEIENPPLVLAALKLPDEIFHEEQPESVDEVDFCHPSKVLEKIKPKFKRKTTFHALLQHDKVDVNAQNRAGITALHVACSKGNHHMVKELLQVGDKLELDLEDKHQNTPLHAACAHGNQRVVESLLEAGANYQAENSIGRYPLHVAVAERNLKVVVTILQHAASDNQLEDLLCKQDKRGFTVFLMAIRSGDEKIVKFLLEKKLATITDKCNFGFNCFHFAAIVNKDKMLRMIYEYNESVSMQLLNDADTASGDTPLHVAAEENQVDALKFLIEK